MEGYKLHPSPAKIINFTPLSPERVYGIICGVKGKPVREFVVIHKKENSK